MPPPTKLLLIRDLNLFLEMCERGTLPKSDVMTMPLTDELRGIQTNVKLNDSLFYKPYLNNLIPLADTSYLIQFSYLGVDKGVPELRASFGILAKQNNDHFIFYSTLSYTKNWRRECINNVTFIFQNTIDSAKALQFARLDSFYNVKINTPDQHTTYIQADNFPQALQLVGINFKSDYAGYSYNSLSDHIGSSRVVIAGRTGIFPNFDPHDTWHEKLRTVMADGVINRPVDEGCAYLFGGSWGYSWNQVLDSFMIYVQKHPSADWISLYKNGDKFNMGMYQNAIANILNALIIERIQKEKSFTSVMTLLSCGKRETGDDNYFTTLQKITGITPLTFNHEINRYLAAPPFGRK